MPPAESSTGSSSDSGDPGAALSARLVDSLQQSIREAEGFLPFVEYMDRALYAPGLGYYVNGAHKLGAGGDFVTAPEISPLFGETLAAWLAPVLQQDLDGEGVILEFGGGTGRLAGDVLATLREAGVPWAGYWILEVSPDLRERQREYLQAVLPAEDFARVTWLDALPGEPWRGVVLANEVLDALPVELFRWRDGAVGQMGVSADEGGLVLAERPAPEPLRSAVYELHARCGPWPEGYTSEWRPAQNAWVAAAAEHLERGAVVIVDYGFPRDAFYAPERHQGTLVGYHRQQMVLDPLAQPGLMDLTASVDFTAVAEAADAAGLEVAVYAAQGEFLLAAGLPARFDARVGDASDAETTLRAAQAVRMLTLPGEMGERFQVMALTRDCPSLPRAGLPDRRGRL
ncbi:SAM-dependent MidA family methyltransferase [Thioalkalivibrio sp. ALE21]|uniref:class I SAM-dependent methyltransferase n=1 Tax=Thioalkalivibrio sp. ALE21 TaxID=1158175 RepID=UPI000D95CA83|nr:SAM-dependent methyltransferase [Thioalkalivibrio sp. ALE21]PYG01526.1 SAM-dependent MidA family methyltransferase [Thioalkalivibrio sp. ALE21]